MPTYSLRAGEYPPGHCAYCRFIFSRFACAGSARHRDSSYGRNIVGLLVHECCLLLKAEAICDNRRGGIAADITLSKWIVLMTFLLMLFLSFAKRRDDVLRMNETGLPPRKNTIRYNITFINQAITITASVTLVCYIMYTVSPEVIAHLNTEHLYLTSIFVLLGLLRYIQIAVVDKKSGDPTKIIIRDRFTQLIVLAFGLSYLFIIYIL